VGAEEAGRSLKEWKQQYVNQVFTVRFMQAKNIDETVKFRENYDSQNQNSFTMESLILAQDER
jgi:hypothetical protein